MPVPVLYPAITLRPSKIYSQPSKASKIARYARYHTTTATQMSFRGGRGGFGGRGGLKGATWEQDEGLEAEARKIRQNKGVKIGLFPVRIPPPPSLDS